MPRLTPSPQASSPSRPDLHLVLAGGPADRTSTAPSRAPAPPGRLVGVDAARVLATLAVVWVHVAEMQGHGQGWSALGRFGTSFYITVVALLGVRSALRHPGRGVREELVRGAPRFLLPFVAWSLIYGAFYGQYALRHGHSFADLATWWGPFAGTARHLWFLPFAWASYPFCNWVVKRTRDWTSRELGLLFTSVGIGSYAVCFGLLFFLLPRGFIVSAHLHRIDRWVEEFPLLASSICACLWLLRRPRTPASPRLALGFASAFLVVEAVYGRYVVSFQEFTHHLDARYVSQLAGALLLLTFVSLPDSRLLRFLVPFRHVTYFAFLAHLIVLEAAGGWLYNTPGFGTLPFAVGTTLAVFTVSALLGAVVRKVPGLRRLAGAH